MPVLQRVEAKDVWYMTGSGTYAREMHVGSWSSFLKRSHQERARIEH